MTWQDRLRLAHVRRARRRKHRKCSECRRERTVCASCARVICTHCGHECAFANAPTSKRTSSRTSSIIVPAILSEYVQAHRLEVKSVTDESNGHTLVCIRPDSTPMAERLTALKTHLPKGWKIWGAGANKPGTFYITLTPE